jgi:hypothetical protein
VCIEGLCHLSSAPFSLSPMTLRVTDHDGSTPGVIGGWPYGWHLISGLATWLRALRDPQSALRDCKGRATHRGFLHRIWSQQHAPVDVE